MYISAMHRIFIQAGEIILDIHALNRPFKPSLVNQTYFFSFLYPLEYKREKSKSGSQDYFKPTFLVDN